MATSDPTNFAASVETTSRYDAVEAHSYVVLTGELILMSKYVDT